MRARLLGYGLAGLVLIGVSAWGNYITHRRAEVPVNLALTLKDMNGADVRLSDFKGRPLLVNFWATWCLPCQLETPELVELSAEYKDRGLTIIGISTDDTADEVKAYAAKYKIPYPLLIGADREDVAAAFGLGSGIPTTFFIRRDGTIAERLEGINTKAWFHEHIQALF